MPVRPPLTSTGVLSALTGSLLLAGLLLGFPPRSPAKAPAPTNPPLGATPPPGDGMVTIESDSQQADNRTGIVTATGNVRIQYPDRRMVATSRQAQYYSREGRLVLTGDVDVIDADGQRIRAEKLVYRLDSERLQAEPQPGRQVFSRLRLQSQPAPFTTGAPTSPQPLRQPQPLRP
jgi:lipopolysaccharide export system protein LptA